MISLKITDIGRYRCIAIYIAQFCYEYEDNHEGLDADLEQGLEPVSLIVLGVGEPADSASLQERGQHRLVVGQDLQRHTVRRRSSSLRLTWYLLTRSAPPEPSWREFTP